MRLARLGALSADERRETLRAALCVPLCAVSVRLLGLQRTRHWIERALTRRTAATPRAEAIAHAVRALERIRWYSPVGGTCLTRSLALQWLLGRSGIRTDLRIGVETAAGLAAHAWIECDGVVLNDVPDVATRYAPLSGRTRVARTLTRERP